MCDIRQHQAEDLMLMHGLPSLSRPVRRPAILRQRLLHYLTPRVKATWIETQLAYIGHVA